MIQKRKSKPKRVMASKDEEHKEQLEKYENDCHRIKSKIAVKNILELKDYYLHQQDTQVILMKEIEELEQEKENKKQKKSDCRDMLSYAQLMKEGMVDTRDYLTKYRKS